jgi:signal transduction histidine kinase
MEIINELSPIAAEAGISLFYNSLGDLQLTQSNRSLIFSMFYNVVNNAVRNTRAAGEVTVMSSINQKRFNVTVTDTGIGIGEEQLRNLFSRFNSKSNMDEDHVGIGLAITKSIADFHNISISVESKINLGSTFSFRFPETS